MSNKEIKVDVRKLSKKQIYGNIEMLKLQKNRNNIAITNLIQRKKSEEAILFAIKNYGLEEAIKMLEKELGKRTEVECE